MPRCTGKHGPWVTYVSYRYRQCLMCDATEPMYSNKGVVPDDPTIPLVDEATVRAAREE